MFATIFRRRGKAQWNGGTINLGSGDQNLRTKANAAGYPGNVPANVTFVVPAGTSLIGPASGGRGLDTGVWPAGTHTITLIIGGNVYGGGGDGNGYAGGDAIFCQTPITITINVGGQVKGGGGGGNPGAGTVDYDPFVGIVGGEPYLGGGGGGGGQPNGLKGISEYGASGDGFPGTLSGPGGGGPGESGTYQSGGSGFAGGAFGNPGGGGGGAAGYAIRKNGLLVPVTNNGTIVGTNA